jgi:hypothetical protein
VDPSLATPFSALVDLGDEHLGQEREVGQLRSLRVGRDALRVCAHDGQFQVA